MSLKTIIDYSPNFYSTKRSFKQIKFIIFHYTGMKKESDSLERLKNIQLDLHKDFIKVVEDSRGAKLKKDTGLELFSGEFWAGSKAKELGLIDGIGNANQVLKEKFGEKVIIKTFEKPKGFIARKLSSSNQDPVEKLVNLIEEKSMWQKFGL